VLSAELVDPASRIAVASLRERTIRQPDERTGTLSELASYANFLCVSAIYPVP